MKSPPVWNWYRLYCLIMSALNIAAAPYGIAVLKGTATITLPQADDPDTAEALLGIVPVIGWSIILTGVVFAILNLAILYIPKKPWAYSAHLVNIILGCLTCVMIPFCLPLIFAWMKPKTKEYFGVLAARRPEFEL